MARLKHHQWKPWRICLFQLGLHSGHIDELVEELREYMCPQFWTVRSRIYSQRILHTNHTSCRLFMLSKFQSSLWSFEVNFSLLKAFLKGLEEKNYKIRLVLTNHNPRIFFQRRGGHIAQSPVVLSHPESILLRSNSSFVASFQRLKIKWVINYDS